MNFNAQSKHDGQLHINVEFALFLLLIGTTFLIRVTHVTYNTLFVDEAIYVTVGKEVLANIYSQVASTWMYGSYLYPFAVGLVDQFMGVVGIRVLSAALSTLAAIFVFLTTWRLFGKQSGLWAMLVFSLTGISISLGQLAVYDNLCIPLLVIALYCLVTAAHESVRNTDFHLLTAALAFSLSVLVKYIAIVYLPVLLLITFTLCRLRNRSVRPLLTKFLLPVIIVLGLYAFYYRADLSDLVNSNYSYQPIARPVIVQTIWEEIGVVILMAVAGIGLLLRESLARQGVQTRRTMLALLMLIFLLLLSFLAIPIYQLAAGNFRSLWKHSVYCLIFLSPLAGYALATLVWQSRLQRGRWTMQARLVGAAITVFCLAGFTHDALDRNRDFQHSWPQVTDVVEYMRSQRLTTNSRVLAAGSAIYEYYFNFGPTNHDVWNNTWYLKYKELLGTDAMAAAIVDHQFNFVVLDDYYTPEVNQKLEAALATAGYVMGYEEKQWLGSGNPITIRVYTNRSQP